VLCGTLADATALADRLGFEALQQGVQLFRTLAQACVQQHAGTFQPLGEEGFLALFGVHTASEAHAEHAVQAALALQQRLRDAHAEGAALCGEALTARVSVHTGWGVVGSRTAEPPSSLVVGGDTTQGAMRLQALAEPGTILVSDTTLRLLRGAMRSEAYGLVRAPGHAEPLMAYTVLGTETQGSRVLSPFVGRQRERGALNDLLVRALDGQGQVVGIVGEPGMGKSRLLAEFRESLQDRAMTFLEGSCRAST
jgi:class 3 adenylate cyclase